MAFLCQSAIKVHNINFITPLAQQVHPGLYWDEKYVPCWHQIWETDITGYLAKYCGMIVLNGLERVRIMSEWEMEVQNNIWEVKMQIKQTEILRW